MGKRCGTSNMSSKRGCQDFGFAHFLFNPVYVKEISLWNNMNKESKELKSDT